MPYISPPRREAYSLFKQAVKETRIDNPGELAYLICWACDQYVGGHLMEFSLLNGVVGVLESCKIEFVRNMLVPYEQGKQAGNGDVWRQE